jgi:soluble lytic murein transglycosylase-like protein
LVFLVAVGCETAKHQVHDEPQQEPSASNNDNDVLSIIKAEERRNGIPDGLLLSIATVESGCSPYAVNTARKAVRLSSKDEAVRFVEAKVQRGNRNMSIGCMQLHHRTHSKNFASVSDMFDCAKNVAYAADLLKALHDKYGSWEKAVRAYHSGKAKYNTIYYRKVMRQYGGDKQQLVN